MGPDELMLEGGGGGSNPVMDYHIPSRGGLEILHRNQDKLWPDGPLGSTQTLRMLTTK